ncbi:MAG: hypothetical protein QMD36_00040 [Candidatus Aenigmarchaeota archaeon]|nr:hypothetical protein [Candidatus Aenigmarchaeota archaeon]
MKAQAASEFLIMVSVALTILIPLILLVNQSLMDYRDNTKISLAKEAVRKLGENADWVFSQGPPAKVTVEVYIPEDVVSASLNNKMILYQIRTSAGVTDVYYYTVSNLTGTLPEKSGYYFVSLTSFSKYVNITVI